MAFINLGSGSTTYQSSGVGDTIVVAEDVLRTNGNDAIRLTHADISISVFGQIFGGDDGLQAGGGNNVITLGATAKVVATDSMTSDKSAVELAASDGNSVYNYGFVSGNKGIDANGSENTRVTNYGDILGHATALDLGESATFENFGTVQGAVKGTGVSLTNSGTINGDVDILSSVSRINILVNRGFVDGFFRSFGNSSDYFDLRDGVVTGTITAGAGDDIYVINESILKSEVLGATLTEFADQGTDQVLAYISFELPANFERLSLAGAENLNGVGNAQDNNLTGNAGNNRLAGRDGSDTMFGRRGDDRLIGGDGSDDLNGGGGDDTLLGNRGNDSLSGENGRDRLSGGKGIDVLNGGNGKDILIGNIGADTMTGGDGADVFTFNRRSDSGLGTRSDKIQDFQPGADLLDLRDVANGQLKFLGTAKFSGDKPAVRVLEQATKTVVLVDTDGDGTAEMRIFLNGTSGVQVDDLLL